MTETHARAAAEDAVEKPGETWVAETPLSAGAIGLAGAVMQNVTHIAPAIAAFFFTATIVSFAGGHAPLAYLLGFLVVLALGTLLVASGASAACAVTDIEVKEWDVVRVPPGTWRGYEGGPEGLEILVFGAPRLGENPRDVGQLSAGVCDRLPIGPPCIIGGRGRVGGPVR